MRKKIWISIAFVLAIIACFAVLGSALQPSGSNDLMVAVTSLAVALMALFISMRTFYSIDEVNAISRMDGNVMENSRYRPNILRAVFMFQQTDFAAASKALMKHMEQLFENNNKQSGAHLADNVQEVADMMVLIPFFIHTGDKQASSVHLQRVSKLLNTMRSQVNNFKEVTDGSCKLLEETISLIDAVFAYQKMTANGKSDPSKLLEVRGSLFVNPVTCVLYHNYIGLYYLKRATNLLCDFQANTSLKQIIESASTCSIEKKSLALIYACKASDSFLQARKNIGDDLIWSAFVCFNIARAEYMKQLLNEAPNDWEKYINESIRCWISSNQIIYDHLAVKLQAGQVSWLQQALISQENKVRLYKVACQMMRNEQLTDYNGNKWVERYEDITKTDFFNSIPEKDPQSRTDDLVTVISEIIVGR